MKKIVTLAALVAVLSVAVSGNAQARTYHHLRHHHHHHHHHRVHH